MGGHNLYYVLLIAMMKNLAKIHNVFHTNINCFNFSSIKGIFKVWKEDHLRVSMSYHQHIKTCVIIFHCTSRVIRPIIQPLLMPQPSLHQDCPQRKVYCWATHKTNFIFTTTDNATIKTCTTIIYCKTCIATILEYSSIAITNKTKNNFCIALIFSLLIWKGTTL